MQSMIANGGSPALTMTSREIADLTDKKHAHVRRDIEVLLCDLGESTLGYLHSWIHPQNGQSYPEYRLDRELTETLLTGYSAVLRRKVIARWRELETGAAKAQHMVPQSLSEALRLAADLADQKAKLDTALALAAPKVAALDRIATRAQGSMCITDAAKDLQIQPKHLFIWLQQNLWIYRRVGGNGFKAYQSRLQSGLLDHKITVIEHSDGTTKMLEQVLVTAKGLTQLAVLTSANTPSESFP